MVAETAVKMLACIGIKLFHLKVLNICQDDKQLFCFSNKRSIHLQENEFQTQIITINFSFSHNVSTAIYYGMPSLSYMINFFYIKTIQ